MMNGARRRRFLPLTVVILYVAVSSELTIATGHTGSIPPPPPRPRNTLQKNEKEAKTNDNSDELERTTESKHILPQEGFIQQSLSPQSLRLERHVEFSRPPPPPPREASDNVTPFAVKPPPPPPPPRDKFKADSVSIAGSQSVKRKRLEEGSSVELIENENFSAPSRPETIETDSAFEAESSALVPHENSLRRPDYGEDEVKQCSHDIINIVDHKQSISDLEQTELLRQQLRNNEFSGNVNRPNLIQHTTIDQVSVDIPYYSGSDTTKVVAKPPILIDSKVTAQNRERSRYHADPRFGPGPGYQPEQLQRLQQNGERPYRTQEMHQQGQSRLNYGNVPPSGSRRNPQQWQQRSKGALVVRRPPPLAKSSTWKSIWRKIEKGLDGLADVEEMVTTHAQKIYSSATAAVADKVPSAVVRVPTSGLNRNAEIINGRDDTMTSWQNKYQQQSVAGYPITKKDEENNAIGMFQKRTIQPMQLHRSPPTNQQPSKPTPSQSSPTRMRRDAMIPTEDAKRLIHANGGASSPENEISDVNEESVLSPEQMEGLQDPAPAREAIAHPYTQHPPASLQRNDDSKGESAATRAFWQNARMVADQTTITTRPFPDEDEDSASFIGKIGSVLTRFPSLSLLNVLRRRGSSAEDLASATLDAWRAQDENGGGSKKGSIFRRSSIKDQTTRISRLEKPKEKSQIFASPMTNLMQRCVKEGKWVSLLSPKEKHRCIAIGRQKAFLDVIVVLCIVAGMRNIPSLDSFVIPHTFSEIVSDSMSKIASIFVEAMDTWTPYLLVAAFLTSRFNILVSETRTKSLVQEVDAAVGTESQYGALFLRLVSSVNTSKRMPRLMQDAARVQIESKIDVARLQNFVRFMLVALFTMTASVLGPLIGVGIITLGQLFSLEQWRAWPLNYRSLVNGVISVLIPVGEELRFIFKEEFGVIFAEPIRFAFEASVFVALVLVSFLPKLEQTRASPSSSQHDDGAERLDEAHKFTEQIWNMGASGSNRLRLLSVNGRVESVLERWRALMPLHGILPRSRMPWRSIFRLFSYNVLSCFVLLFPLFVHNFVGPSLVKKGSRSLLRWDNISEVAVVFYVAYRLIWQSFCATVNATDRKEKVSSFVTSLVETVEERKQLLLAPPPDIKHQLSISPSSGVVIKDLWVAHATRRAWAVRGANISCKNGEILVVLGDEGSGRTRLLTALAEAIVSPPRRSLTAQHVRGSIIVGGLEVSKWENNKLRSRTGIVLNDSRVLSDWAQIMSGLTLEEILDPCDGLKHIDLSHSPETSERACMTLALKITGLYSTLLPRFPSKMSTIVTANEEDLRPSPSRPRYQLLSPGEWSKLLLARTLAQVIYDNDNTVGTTDSVVNCLVGSVLLLDDVALYLSEVEEARLFKDLRQSSAATIITSNRWATGRFADKIVVVKDGAIVETGTHNELLRMGPQQSIYAAKWLSMTTT